MTPEVASLILRCVAALADEGIGPRPLNDSTPGDFPGDVKLYAEAVQVIGEENITHPELRDLVDDLKRRGEL